MEEPAVDRQMNIGIKRIQVSRQTGKKTKMNRTNSGPETDKNGDESKESQKADEKIENTEILKDE